MPDNTADKGLRIGNFVTDLIVTSALYYSIATFLISASPAIFNGEDWFKAIFCTIYFLYYLILETLFGKTIGKMLTKTIVVDKNENKPPFWRILIRSIFRFFPLDIFSYLFGLSGFHDSISGTKVIFNKKITYDRSKLP